MRPRVLFYTEVLYGMGHLAETCSLAKAVKKVMPKSEIILVTGAKLDSWATQIIPKGVEFVKLPSVSIPQPGGEAYPLNLKISVEEIFSIRKNMLSKLYANFRPHVIVVDQQYVGVNNELKAVLKMARRQKRDSKSQLPIKILSIAGINVLNHFVASERKRKKDLDKKSGRRLKFLRKISKTVVKNYDHLFIGVPENIFWCEYAIPKALTPSSIIRIMDFHGYHTNYDSEKFTKRSLIRNRMNLGKKKLIVLSCGGGRDGFEILNSYTKIHSSIKVPVKSILFPGPYMPEDKLRHICNSLRHKKDICIGKFSEEDNLTLADWMDAADLFVGMGGYSTLAEVLITRVPAIIVPRNLHLSPEQFVHAAVLKKADLIEMIDPRNFSPRLLLKAINSSFHQGRLKRDKVKDMLNGSIKAAKQIKALLKG